jgi:hypothetical protein
MKFRLFCIAAALGATSLYTPPVDAQGGIRNARNWKYPSARQVPLKMYQYFPAICRPALQRAASTYTAERSRLQFVHNATVLSTNNLETSRDSDLVVTYSQTMGTAGALAEARFTRDASSTSTTFGNGYVVSDTDVAVNFNLLFYNTGTVAEAQGEFYCPAAAGQPVPTGTTATTGKFDMETVLLHEITHAAGLSHYDPTNCVMFDSVGRGEARRTYCSQESTYLRNLYGVL